LHSIIVAQSSLMVQRRRGPQAAPDTTRSGAGALQFPFVSRRCDVTAGFEHSLTWSDKPIGGNDLLSAAHALTLVIPWLATTQGEFAQVRGLQRRNWLRYSKVKILFLSNYVQPRECRRARRSSTCVRPALLESDRGGSRTHAIGDEHYSDSVIIENDLVGLFATRPVLQWSASPHEEIICL